MLLAVPSASRELVQRVAEAAETTGVAVRVVPSIEEIVRSGLRLQDVRQVRIDDLLGREQVVTDLAAVGDLLGGKRVLVTGGGRLDRVGDHPAGRRARPVEPAAARPRRDPPARRLDDPATAPQLAAGRRPGAGPADPARFERAPSRGRLPRGGAQARADPGERAGRGRPHQRARHPEPHRRRASARRPDLRPDLHRQGRATRPA